MRKNSRFCRLLITILLFVVVPTAVGATGPKALSNGQTLYVPAYSHIYTGNTEFPFLLTVTLSIRNINPRHSITLDIVDYHETQGDHLKAFLEKSVVLQPMESVRYIIPEKDKSGGSGANFIVKWHAEKEVNAPLVETIMIGGRAQQGISFTSRAVEIIDIP